MSSVVVLAIDNKPRAVLSRCAWRDAISAGVAPPEDSSSTAAHTSLSSSGSGATGIVDSSLPFGHLLRHIVTLSATESGRDVQDALTELDRWWVGRSADPLLSTEDAVRELIPLAARNATVTGFQNLLEALRAPQYAEDHEASGPETVSLSDDLATCVQRFSRLLQIIDLSGLKSSAASDDRRSAEGDGERQQAGVAAVSNDAGHAALWRSVIQCAAESASLKELRLVNTPTILCGLLTAASAELPGGQSTPAKKEKSSVEKPSVHSSSSNNVRYDGNTDSFPGGITHPTGLYSQVTACSVRGCASFFSLRGSAQRFASLMMRMSSITSLDFSSCGLSSKEADMIANIWSTSPRESCSTLPLRRADIMSGRGSSGSPLRDILLATASRSTTTTSPPFPNVFQSLTSLQCSGNVMGSSALSKLLRSAAVQTATKLQHLSIDGCGIGPGDPATVVGVALRSMPTLQSINLSQNELGCSGVACLVEHLQTLRSLRSLSICSNLLGDAGAAALSTLFKTNSFGSQLRTLRMSCNRIGAAGAASLASAFRTFAYLEELDVSGNRFGENGWIAIGAACRERTAAGESCLPHLRRLHIQATQMTPLAAQALLEALRDAAIAANLWSLQMDRNVIGRHGSSALKRQDDATVASHGVVGLSSCLRRSHHLAVLSLEGCGLSDDDVEQLHANDAFARLSNLTSLRLSGNILLGPKSACALAKEFTHMHSLAYLDLRGTALGGLGGAELGPYLVDLVRLRTLDVSECRLGDGGVTALVQNLPPSLQELALRQNAISSTGLAALMKSLTPHDKLSSLDLSCNATLGDAGAAVLGKHLEQLPWLQHVLVASCRFTRHGAAHLRQGLDAMVPSGGDVDTCPWTPSLQTFDGSGNPFGVTGVIDILGGLLRHRRLAHMCLSHALQESEELLSSGDSGSLGSLALRASQRKKLDSLQRRFSFSLLTLSIS